MTTRHRATLVTFLVGVSLLGSSACKDLVGNAALPAGTQAPDTYNTPAGAVGVYLGVKAGLQSMANVIITSGALTDELAWYDRGSGPGSLGATGDPTDERVVLDAGNNDVLYSPLQKLRGGAAQAIGLLRHYAPKTSLALRGEMYAVTGYAELLLAELYCSGVPLSTLDFQGDFTYQPSSTQTAVYQHAVTLFDSALAISSDSPSVLRFASVAKGRALLDLGQYDSAARAVATVPNSFRYQVPVKFGGGGTNTYMFSYWSVASREGGNGIPFNTADDPRAQVTLVGTNRFSVPIFAPSKYPDGLTSLVVLADGIEARLIEAEAALHAHPDDPSWLTILNALRTTCTTVATCPTPAPAGIGGVDSLAPLTDPGSSPGNTARVTLLFTERAYWLFLTAHRQGDLRRLVRPVTAGGYGWPQQTVYPTGPYFGGKGRYGTDVNLPIPGDEKPNPLFHGCLSRGA